MVKLSWVNKESIKSGPCIAHMYYCFHMGSLQEIAIQIFSLVFFALWKTTKWHKGYPRYWWNRKQTQLTGLTSWPIKWPHNIRMWQQHLSFNLKLRNELCNRVLKSELCVEKWTETNYKSTCRLLFIFRKYMLTDPLCLWAHKTCK